MEKESLQYNCQDLDQEQNMDVMPVQNNTQRIHLVVNNEKMDYSGKITGITYYGRQKRIVNDVGILLYFGNESNFPVSRTKSEFNGRFKLEELPPGFYTIRAKYGESETLMQCIKVLPGQEVFQALFL